ncbi:CU044_5270 family protein [Sphaerisporangium aureirubrum]|uniref:CU044_5270 family protein n=1 Tax=Sphaerisporangium aureirubrum TaxID=1544736 RepID=A0ABW1NTE3_9ACTN
MNPMDRLRDARPAHLGDTAIDERTRDAELSYAMAQARPVKTRRGWVRPVWSLGLTGAAAAITAVAVTLSGTAHTPGTVAAGQPPSASGAPAAATPQIELSASAILLAAAEQADRQPDEMRAYWHTVTVTRSLSSAGGYNVLDQGRGESWTPSALGGETWSRSQSLGARPATPADEEAWRAAGSPEEIHVKVPGKRGELIVPTKPGRVRVEHSPLFEGDKVFWLGRNVTMKELRDLPSDPARLKAWLLRAYGGHGTEGDTPMSSDEWLFTVASGLITDMPVTAKTRGAAFRMLAKLKTITVVPGVVDAEGRTGTAVAIEQASKVKATDKTGGVLQSRLIFDESTGQALGTDSVVVRPGGYQAELAPGTIWHSSTVLSAEWTDTKPSS